MDKCVLFTFAPPIIPLMYVLGHDLNLKALGGRISLSFGSIFVKGGNCVPLRLIVLISLFSGEINTF